jgi:hypothetical protein
VVRPPVAFAFCVLVIIAAIPAFMLRMTGVMDDSVFWVVGKSLQSGKLLYRDIFFTQPPLFTFIPQAVWMAGGDIFAQRSFLLAVWLVNGALLYLIVWRMERALRVVALGLFLVSSFVLQSYALHTETFVLLVFLAGALAIARQAPATDLIVGLAAATTLCIKPIGPVVFAPCILYLLTRQDPANVGRRLLLMATGACIPVAAMAAYFVYWGNALEFWQQVVVDNTNIGLSTNVDWPGYVTLAFAPLLVPLFAAIVVVDRRPTHVEWWVAVATFSVLLAIELLRGARHYGLLNLCVLVWMLFRAQEKFDVQRIQVRRIGVATLMALATLVQVVTVREILGRGSIIGELSAASFVRSLPHGSLHVFANAPPRWYMLMNELPPAYAYLFVYDTNRDLVNWDSYRGMLSESPPDYIAVEDTFQATEYGRVKSVELTTASAVRAWIERRGEYRQLDVGRGLGLALYQRSSARTNDPIRQGGT